MLVANEDFDGDALRQAGELLYDTDRLALMAEQALAVGRPRSAAASADLVLRLATREPLPSQDELDHLTRGAEE